MGAAAGHLTVLQITDTHLFDDADARLLGVNTAVSLQAVLGHALADTVPDLLLVTGDVAHDEKEATYVRFVELVRARYSGEMMIIAGNHDAADPMRRVAPPGIQRFEKGAWTVLGIDTHRDGAVEASFDAADLEDLEQALESRTTPYALVAGHHPPVPVRAPWLDEHRIMSGEALVDVLAAAGVGAYVCGHVHQQFEEERRGVALLTTPSTCFQFRPSSERFAVDERPPGFRWLTLGDDGTVTTVVERLEGFDLGLDTQTGGY